MARCWCSFTVALVASGKIAVRRLVLISCAIAPLAFAVSGAAGKLPLSFGRQVKVDVRLVAEKLQEGIVSWFSRPTIGCAVGLIRYTSRPDFIVADLLHWPHRSVLLSTERWTGLGSARCRARQRVLRLRKLEYADIIVVGELHGVRSLPNGRAPVLIDTAHRPLDVLRHDLAHHNLRGAIVVVAEKPTRQEVGGTVVLLGIRLCTLRDVHNHIVGRVVERPGRHHGARAAFGNPVIRPGKVGEPFDGVGLLATDLLEHVAVRLEVLDVLAAD